MDLKLLLMTAKKKFVVLIINFLPITDKCLCWIFAGHALRYLELTSIKEHYMPIRITNRTSRCGQKFNTKTAAMNHTRSCQLCKYLAWKKKRSGAIISHRSRCGKTFRTERL